MIFEILIGLLVTVLSAIAAALYRRGYVHVVVDNTLFFLAPSGINEQRELHLRTTALQRKIVRLILRDQTRFGRRRGEYGKNSGQHRKWQPRDSRESLDLKPRMYLTYWPVMVLRRHHLAERSVNLATSGVARLFRNGRIPLHSSEPGIVPTAAPQRWSHRHSMAGAHLLSIGRAGHPVTWAVIDLMLDQRNGWQDASGGWWHTNDRGKRPDLWASVYAVKLLEFAASPTTESDHRVMPLVASALQRTFSFFEVEWASNRWSDPGRLLTEENLVLMFIDLAPLLPRYCPSLHVECIKTMRDWLSPGGDLSQNYLATLAEQSDPVSEEQAYSRMAYAFYLAQCESVDWRRFFERAARSSLTTLFSSELAFLLDMSFEDSAPPAQCRVAKRR